ncbi:MAG: chemotaxis protein CheW [Phyllobacterium sp.]
MEAIKQTFFQECEEQLAELETGLLTIERNEADSDTVNAVFRAVHSIKGGAGAFGIDSLVQFAHVFETTLDEMRSDRLAATPDVMKVLLRSSDMLADLVQAARDGASADTARSEILAQELEVLVGGSAGYSDTGSAGADDGMDGIEFLPVTFAADIFPDDDISHDEAGFHISFRPKSGLYAKGNDAVRILRELSRLGEATIQCNVQDIPLLNDIDPEGAYLEWTIDLKTQAPESDVREVFEFVEWDCDLSITGSNTPLASLEDMDVEALLRQIEASNEPFPDAPSVSGNVVPLMPQQPARTEAPPADQKSAATNVQTTIRADLSRVDRLIDLVGELVINQAMLSQRVIEAGHASTSAVAMGLDELEQLTREIQECVMAIRAQSVKSVFQRMPRLVREVADMTGKAVRLITEGEGTEVDKTVIDRLTDPLTHMIRNAIDHGLETPEVRIAAGKPEEGTVRLSAMHRSGRIVIEIADDGAGINRAKVKEIAISKGLIAADASLADDEIDNLIFLPGFSTASTVSNISGRGVGMDVVKRSIQSLGGRVSIASRPGKGSTFTMSLPLTLAVLDGMVVTVAGQTLVVPLTAIIETLQPKTADVHGFGGNTRVISIRDAFTPLIDVGCELGYRREATDPQSAVAILVETEGSTRSALLVDAIQGQRQVVIKSLEANYGHVEGIAAATILGDGRVALILDVDAVVMKSRIEAHSSERQLEAAS